MVNSEQTANDLIQKIIKFLQEKDIDMEDVHELRRRQLEQIIQFGQFQMNVEQILNWIRNGESMLKSSFYIPTSLQTAENLKTDHEQFQEAIEVCSFFYKVFSKQNLNILFLFTIENALSCHLSAPKS